MRVFIDMDGVIVDFDRFRDERGLTGDEVKAMPGAYLDMPAIPGAIEAVRSVIGMGFEVWLATKPPTGIPHAYSDKAAWVLKHLPELKRRIIITHDKGLLGSPADVLCDDRPHKANCMQFPGRLLSFVDGYHWPQALEFLRARRDALRGDPDRWRRMRAEDAIASAIATGCSLDVLHAMLEDEFARLAEVTELTTSESVCETSVTA